MKIVILLALLGLSISALAQPLTLSREVFEAWREPFKSHRGTKPFTNYLTMEIPYAPVEKLFQQVEKRLGRKLGSRLEAHITVITPPEFDNQLSPAKVTMNEIDAIALRNDIQNSPFRIICLGSRSAVKPDGKPATAYYLIIESPALMNIRQQIAQLALTKNRSSKFKPEKYYGHITVGFIHDDVHESDGIVKDLSSCIAPVKIK